MHSWATPGNLEGLKAWSCPVPRFVVGKLYLVRSPRVSWKLTFRVWSLELMRGWILWGTERASRELSMLNIAGKHSPPPCHGRSPLCLWDDGTKLKAVVQLCSRLHWRLVFTFYLLLPTSFNRHTLARRTQRRVAIFSSDCAGSQAL